MIEETEILDGLIDEIKKMPLEQLMEIHELMIEKNSRSKMCKVKMTLDPIVRCDCFDSKIKSSLVQKAKNDYLTCISCANCSNTLSLDWTFKR